MTRSHALPRCALVLSLWFPSFFLAGVARGGEDDSAEGREAACTDVPPLPTYRDWPRIRSAIRRDPAQEAWIAGVVRGMTLAQKVGQMTQPEAANATPADVRDYFIGSILSGGNDWPAGKLAPPSGWLEVTDDYWQASMSTGMAVKIPIMYGVDAVHGSQKQFGATLFPHDIGLGATHDACLVERIGAFTARQMRVSGFDYTFAPCVTVPQDDRWGRTYEGFSEYPAITRRLSAAITRGLMSPDPGGISFSGAVTTSKHFIGDGGTARGVDQGVNMSPEMDLINIHGQGYFASLAAGAQTVMASYNSWTNPALGIVEGKVHGSRYLITEVLKQKMGFDGIVISDYNGIGQVTGCSNTRCAQAINAGIDLFMVPQEWKQFIADTIDLVESGEVPMSRIDDAVTRIIRVKLRAGLFDLPRPSQRPGAGAADSLVDHDLGREAVRKSLVLLKNNGKVLPLRRDRKILLVGKSGDSIASQCGGWSLGWQNAPPFDDNGNQSFPAGQSVLAALRDVVGEANVTFSPTADGVDFSGYDVVIAVIGETPYAEFIGDIIWNPLYSWGPTGGAPPEGQAARETLEHAVRNPEDIALLGRVSGRGVPVVTVFLSGRPLYTSRELNRSDAFVAAWLPGTEAAGITDVLFRDAKGGVNHDFQGRLPYSWPRSACQTPLNLGDPQYDPLFPVGYGLTYRQRARVPELDETPGPAGGCPN